MPLRDVMKQESLPVELRERAAMEREDSRIAQPAQQRGSMARQTSPPAAPEGERDRPVCRSAQRVRLYIPSMFVFFLYFNICCVIFHDFGVSGFES